MTKPARLLLMFAGGLALLAALLVLLNARAVAQTGGWRGEYYDNPNMLGTPRFVRIDPVIDFNWWDGSPGPTIPADQFSVRWTQQQYFNNGNYRFAATMDDGMRIYLDDQLIIDSWFLSAAHTMSKDVLVRPGTHTITVEYFEGTGQALAEVDITPVTDTSGGGDGGDTGGLYPNWKGEYFANPNVSGAPAYVRDDRYLNFNWGQGSPVPGVIPTDFFSVRWTRTDVYPAGQYKMLLTSDDGARMYINGALIVDNWTQPLLTPVEASYWHPGGAATIRVDYYDATVNASIRLDLIQVPGGAGVLPPGYPVQPQYPIPQCPGMALPTGLSAVVISPSNLNVRRDPTTLSEAFGQFASCSTIPLTGYRDASGQWVQTTLNGVTGWVTAQYLVLGTPIQNLTVGP